MVGNKVHTRMGGMQESNHRRTIIPRLELSMEPSSRDSLPVVIVGGGFGGVTLAQHLEKQLDNAIEIIVISRDNHLVFTPMLPEVAARTISPLHVIVAGRQITKRTRWIAASTTGIDLERRGHRMRNGHGSAHS